MLVHYDLCCINKPSSTSANYILTFIDYLSRFNWVHFFKNKSHVFENFKVFKASAKKQRGQLITCLRSNNGGEYVSQQFEEYLSQSSISWKIYVPHTPKHNGMDERKNMTLVKMVHCLLQTNDLLTKSWVE